MSIFLHSRAWRWASGPLPGHWRSGRVREGEKGKRRGKGKKKERKAVPSAVAVPALRCPRRGADPPPRGRRSRLSAALRAARPGGTGRELPGPVAPEEAGKIDICGTSGSLKSRSGRGRERCGYGRSRPAALPERTGCPQAALGARRFPPSLYFRVSSLTPAGVNPFFRPPARAPV